uniref:Uncharacterized protein n=1 Tax=Oryctolagus cuniculus TaxID=9986 RepID=A0A5F9CH97_RABIT
MMYHGQGQNVYKVMVQPISLIFRHLPNRSGTHVLRLCEQVSMWMESWITVGAC